MSDLEDEMERTKERAAAFGVSGETDDKDEEDESESVAEQSTTEEGDERSEAEEALETSEISPTVEGDRTPEIEERDGSAEPEQTGEDVPSDVEGESKPTADNATTSSEESSRGRLVDEYDNVNIYIPPELKRDLNDLFKLMDLEYSRSKSDDLEKHWDFYPAVIRTVLENEEDLRAELGIDE
ncbi:hypothetical protein [Halorubrum trueperi]|uniref:DUF8160 domain-containing protein n=1 Tax=Halorubrum trueperi TaxID=2004704 RepID=A0ABD5ULL6_9EURY